MSCKWMREVEKREERQTNSFISKRQKAKEMSKEILNKYKVGGLADLNCSKLTKKEKETIFNSWLLCGYSEESVSLIVYNNTYQYRL